MQLLTKSIEAKLRANSKLREGKDQLRPVVKLFHPNGAATWLITEMEDDFRMFGLCDLGHGYPELGYVELQEIVRFVERDMYFRADKTLLQYAQEARELGRINA